MPVLGAAGAKERHKMQSVMVATIKMEEKKRMDRRGEARERI